MEELGKQEGIKLGAHKTSMQGQKETRKDGKVKEWRKKRRMKWRDEGGENLARRKGNKKRKRGKEK